MKEILTTHGFMADLARNVKESTGLHLAAVTLAGLAGGGMAATGGLDSSTAEAAIPAGNVLLTADPTPSPSPSSGQESVTVRPLAAHCADFNTRDGSAGIMLTGTQEGTQETATITTTQTDATEGMRFKKQERQVTVTNQDSSNYTLKKVPVGVYQFSVDTSNGQQLTVKNYKVKDCRRPNIEIRIDHRIWHDKEGNSIVDVRYNNKHSSVGVSETARVSHRGHLIKTLHKYISYGDAGDWVLGAVPKGSDTVKVSRGTHLQDKYTYHVH